MTNRQKLLVGCGLTVFAVAGRLLPHPWNATPFLASVLIAGVYLGAPSAFTVLLVAGLASDALLGFYEWRLMLVVYGCYAFVIASSSIVHRQKKAEIVAACSFLASTLFYFATNWAVWRFTPWYAKTADGLWQSLVLGLPFFRNALLGDLFYTLILFGCFEYVRSRSAVFSGGTLPATN